MMKVDKFNTEVSGKSLMYVIENDTFTRRCNRCGSVVLRQPNEIVMTDCLNPTESDPNEYPYQCMSCDENLFGIETHEGEYHTDEEFEELCCNTRDLLLLDD